MEQCRKEEDPDLTLIDLLGLTPCEEHIITPLQTLDELYVNQPSRFLPLAQEAKKLAKELKEEEEVSQWSGIPIKKNPQQFIYRAAQLYTSSTTDCSTAQHERVSTSRYYQNT